MAIAAPPSDAAPQSSAKSVRRMGMSGLVLVLFSVVSATGTLLLLVDVNPVAQLLKRWVAKIRYFLGADARLQEIGSDTAYSNAINALFFINAFFIAALIALLCVKLGRMIVARRRGQAGAGLHMRVIGLFSIISALPVLLLAAIAILSLDKGLDNLFSTRVHNIVSTSQQVANSYLDQQKRLIRGVGLSIAADLNRVQPMYNTDPIQFAQILKGIIYYRGLSTILLLTRDGRIVENSSTFLGPGPGAFPLPSRLQAILQDADAVDAIPIAPNPETGKNFIGVVVKLTAFDDRYMLAVAPFDDTVAQYLRDINEGATRFYDLQASRFSTQINFAALYLIIALNMLLVAIWLGFSFAERLVEPIRNLISAADQVGSGNLYVRVPVASRSGDLGKLGDTFNNMTDTLRLQRNELLGANELLDSRRRFIEAVLSGVSTGVIGLDEDGRVTIVNPLAERWFGSSVSPVGSKLVELMPELDIYLTDALSSRSRLVQGQITINRDGRERNLTVRVTTERAGLGEHGYVVTLDDITELVVAQKSSAWADVARRIAHEIKNPLTPIQLSAERIRRKYGRVITEDRDVFDQCTDTIVRQVDDIKRMVDEFSSFARMPKPSIEREDLGEMVRQVVFMMRIGTPDIEFIFTPPAEPVIASFDRRLLSQAVTNIVKNATEAIAGLPDDLRKQGRVSVCVLREAENIAVEVVDNGIGLPKENRQKLLEPYVTTREKGTGLGLAIVSKIMEEHGGGIELFDAPAVSSGGRGATMRLWFPASRTVATESRA